MRILFLARWFPFPANNGSKLRIFNLLRALSTHHQITLVSFYDPPEGDPDLGGLESICKKVIAIPWQEFRPNSFRARLGFFGVAPRWIFDTFSPKMAQTIQDVLHSEHYDLVVASQVLMGTYARFYEGVPALLEEVELGIHYQRYAQAPNWLGRIRHGLAWFKFRRYLHKLLKKFCACTVVSEKELQLLRGIVQKDARIQVIPNCVQLSDYQDILVQPTENTLIYAGSFRYSVNYEAMQWFVREVFPLILQEIPTVQLIVTGDPAGLRLEPDTNVTQVGFVPDIRPVVGSACVSLAPIQTGGGTRLKILEAMALRKPVVATSKGAEGLNVKPGVHLLVADTPQDYAAAVLRLLRDAQLRASIAEAGYQLVEEKYNWQVVVGKFLRWVEEELNVCVSEDLPR